jgi:hypothetical protein
MATHRHSRNDKDALLLIVALLTPKPFDIWEIVALKRINTTEQKENGFLK